MNDFNIIINNINNKIKDRSIYDFFNSVINNWFINLNQSDIIILSIFSTFIAERINNLFIHNDFIEQLTVNDNLDTKAIILLILPYINDENYDVYGKIIDLNELILNKPFTSYDLQVNRGNILKTHFKYSNFGIGIFNTNNELTLNDPEYGKIIYKIIYHNFIALNDTLSIINGKLYINWINIVPLDLDNYKNSIIYNDTITQLSININYLLNDDLTNMLDYTGLYIGDYYNIFRNVYYEQIKKIKWLIYFSNNKYVIQYLNSIFDFDLFFEYNKFVYLDKENQDKFIIQYKNIDENNYNIWKHILIFFSNNYSARNEITIHKEFIINIEEDDNENDFDKKSFIKFNKITNQEISNYLESIDAKHIWDFIKESLNILNSTIYSRYLIINNKITNFIFYKNTKLTLKNIYNIAKSLSHNNTNEWILLPIKYTSLTHEQQKQFWNKIILLDNDWINLQSNLNIEYNKKLSINKYNNILINKLTDFRNIYNDLVWEYLIYNGLLSEFKVNTKITNTINHGSNKVVYIQNELKKNINKYENAYYYLTNKQYKNDNILNIFLTQAWYTFYALDWIAQINFYHHYMNHRVLYITGATGQGKSTQVPKLFLYALKMLDYKISGQVVCTQPRIGPTNGISNRVSNELGVPIKILNNENNIVTNNYYIQYAHSESKHIKQNIQHLSLKFLTDGILLNELINNPTLKSQIKLDNNFIYSNNNIYDIIIIDEAHEHNTNMDLILTLARQSCFINNDVKLVIMSATMEDDEPNFRSYYKIINDNIIYPIRTPKINYFNNNELFFYDNIYLDRRFHIAPPGIGTQYDIKEIYEPNGQVENIVLQILSSSTFGDILIFENGINDIIKRVKKLNTITSSYPDIIALPFYSKLNAKYRNIIEDNFHNNIYNIQTSKNKVCNTTWTEHFISSNDVSIGTYKRAIIIATNVAEASITLSNLKFVIDNGFAKNNIYNYSHDITKLEPEPIPEASRKQRKGRVGRVSSGTIYYLYEKYSRLNILPKYKITQINFGYLLLQLLETKNTISDTTNLTKELDNLLNNNGNINTIVNLMKNINLQENDILPYFFDPNLINYYSKYYNNKQLIYNTFCNETKLNNIILKQYNYDFNLINIYWNPSYYNFMYNKPLYYMYRKLTGYKLNILLDLSCQFYIIHPFEQDIQRNILGQIINYSILPESLIYDMINNLTWKYMLINIEPNSSIFNVNNYYKTEFVNIINELLTSITLDTKTVEDMITILTSYAYGSLYSVLQVLSLIKMCNGSINNLFNNINNINNYNNQDNEIELLYNIIQRFNKYFSYLPIFNIKNYNNIKKLYTNYINILCNDFIKDYKLYGNIPPYNKYDIDVWNNLIELYNKNMLFTEQGFMYIVDSNIVKPNYESYSNDIDIWCKINNINTTIMKDYLYDYTKTINSIFTLKKDNNSDPLSKMDILSNNFIIYSDNPLEPIIKSFIHGYTFNIAFRYNPSDMYHKTLNNTLVLNTDSKSNINNIIFFYSRKYSINPNITFEISITNKINIDWLVSSLPIYYLYTNIKPNENNLNNQIFSKFKNNINSLPFETNSMPILNTFIKKIKKLI